MLSGMSDSTFSEEQKAAVAGWVEAGATLSEIQKRINSEFDKSITYMELRFLVDDLNLALKDKTPAPDANAAAANAPAAAADDEVFSVGDAGGYASSYQSDAQVADDDDAGVFDADTGKPDDADDADAPAGTAKVSVSIDPVQAPGVAASGAVTFTDGQTGKWFLDGYGRLAFEPPYEGYRPAPADVQQFQIVLQKELAKSGY
jgi:hypothetical protein